MLLRGAANRGCSRLSRRLFPSRTCPPISWALVFPQVCTILHNSYRRPSCRRCLSSLPQIPGHKLTLADLAYQTLGGILRDDKASPSVQFKTARFITEQATAPTPYLSTAGTILDRPADGG
jgi:hypothetical protein